MTITRSPGFHTRSVTIRMPCKLMFSVNANSVMKGANPNGASFAPRRSKRMPAQLPVVVQGKSTDGISFADPTRAVILSAQVLGLQIDGSTLTRTYSPGHFAFIPMQIVICGEEEGVMNGALSFFDNCLLTRISLVRKTDSQAGDDVPSAPSPCWFRPHPEKTSGGLYDQFSST